MRAHLAVTVVIAWSVTAIAQDCPTLAGSTGAYSNYDAMAAAGDYVYSGAWGFRVFDVSDPAAPEEVGSDSTWAYGLAISGNYAYGGGYDLGLMVWDISTPTSPTVVATAPGRGIAFGVAVSGGFAYMTNVGDGGALQSGLQIFDISDPDLPTEVGFWEGSTEDVAVSGEYAYVADYSGALIVIDVSDPALADDVATLGLPGYPIGIALSGTYAFMAARWDGLRIVDISDPLVPVEVASVPTYDATDVTVVGDLAFVADNYGNSLRIIDVSTPTSPVEIGVYPCMDRVAVVAAAPGYAYIGEDGGAFMVIDVDPVSDCPASIFPDGFELGTTDAWSAVSP
jgi:hypothetical protein